VLWVLLGLVQQLFYLFRTIKPAYYIYDVEGKTYHGKRVSPWIIVASHNAKFILKDQLSKVETYTENKVIIFYKPSNSDKSWLISPSKLGVFITILISVTTFS